jgi:SAM-dependent methyltransferase
MTHGDARSLGYQEVDRDPDVAALIRAMDETAEWEATRALRVWERAHLGSMRGARLLDVGCGPGTACLALAASPSADRELVGIDLSEAMVGIARARAAARAVPSRVRFSVGDARSLDEPDNAFDVVRSERTLQWLADPSIAVAEMVRVVRPGGRIALIDTDWATFRIDTGDDAVAGPVRDAMREERNRASNVGRRLDVLLSAAGCAVVAQSEATQEWTDWDPASSPAPAGLFSMESLADDLVATGHLAPDGRERFVAAIHEAAARGRLEIRLTMFGAVAVAP